MANGEKNDILELHVCRGLNTCAGHGKDGSGTMPGDGSCATATYHSCAGKNECRSQAGCGRGPAEMQTAPSENACKAMGGCAVPITTNVHDAGPAEGRSVWEHARELFEERMKRTGKEFGAAPGSEA